MTIQDTRSPLGNLPRLDALRAIAVMLVLLFHLDLEAFHFGYLGVDLFLLLSGFLMTFTMVQDRNRFGYFRIGAFYKRRAMRLLPSLIVTIAICLIGALVIMSPSPLIDMAYQGASAQLFVSNIYFYGQAGYFEPANELRPLLHTWSLSLEEQFYLLFGVALLLGNRMRFSILLWSAFFSSALFTLAGLASAAGLLNLSIWPTPEKLPEALFYLLPFRAVQFLAGCVIALIYLQNSQPSKTPLVRFNLIGESLRLALPLAMIVLLLNFPIYEIHAPNLMIVSCGPLLWRSHYLDILGRNVIVRFLAKISYQVYLTHWPLITFWKYYTFAEIHAPQAVALSVVSIASGWLLFQLIDRRAVALRSQKYWLISAITGSLVLFIAQIAVLQTSGLAHRIPAERVAFDSTKARAQETAFCGQTHLAKDGRELGDRAEDPLITCENIRGTSARLYLLGDSHARHLVPGFSAAYPNRSIAAIYFTSCLAQSGIREYYYDYEGRNTLASACAQRNNAMLSYFKNHEPAQIVIHQYSGYEGDQSEQWYAAAQDILDKLNSFGHHVIWVGFVPYPDILLADCLSATRIFSAAALGKRCLGDIDVATRILQADLQLQNAFPSHYLSAATFFCPQGNAKSCQYLINGQPMFRDKEHLTVQGSELFVKWLRSAYPQMPN